MIRTSRQRECAKRKAEQAKQLIAKEVDASHSQQEDEAISVLLLLICAPEVQGNTKR